MKITIKHKDTTIIVDESDNETKYESKASMRWGDQNLAIQNTIEVMCKQVKILTETTRP